MNDHFLKVFGVPLEVPQVGQASFLGISPLPQNLLYIVVQQSVSVTHRTTGFLGAGTVSGPQHPEQIPAHTEIINELFFK